MGWSYQISMQCGKSHKAQAQCLDFLASLAPLVPRSFLSQSIDDEGDLWASYNVSDNDMDGHGWAQLLSKLWNAELMQLPFQYAIAGLEVDQLRTNSELLQEEDLSIFPCLAVSEAVWKALGSPSTLVENASGKFVHIAK